MTPTPPASALVPRVVVGAPTSGTGKTTIATGLMAALRAEGLAVSGHKVGPDFIDPGWHAVATGREGRNLDPVLVGDDTVAPLLVHGAATPEAADVAVIEGVMGLFDGAMGQRGRGSTAHVAKLTSSPIVLVVDASRTSRSVAATIHGFATFDPDVRLGGVIVNRVATARHEREVVEAVDATGVPLLGVLPRQESLGVPSRHLGLVTAAEHDEAAQLVERMGSLVAEHCDLAAVLSVAHSAPALTARAWDPLGGAAPRRDAPTIAVFGGPAFTFRYAELAEAFTAHGTHVHMVDPLVDEDLPAGTAGMFLCGGFPELYAETLSRNATLRADVRAAVDDGIVTVAECGGLTYLCETLDGHPMCGAISANATMTGRLTLGYRNAVALRSHPLAPHGARLTGHEFHRTRVDPASGGPREDRHAIEALQGWTDAWAWQLDSPTQQTEGFARDTALATYLHTHPAGAPSSVHRLVGNVQ